MKSLAHIVRMWHGAEESPLLRRRSHGQQKHKGKPLRGKANQSTGNESQRQFITGIQLLNTERDECMNIRHVGNPTRLLFLHLLLLLQVCVCMFPDSMSLWQLLLKPFLSFPAFCSPPLFSLWCVLFYLVLVTYHIRGNNLFQSELFVPRKISHSSCQLNFLFSSWFKVTQNCSE